MHRDETLAEEFARLTKEYHTGDEDTKPEAWNLLADFAVDNATVITAALSEQTLPVRVGALEWEKTLDRYKGSERREQWMAKTPWGGLYIWHYQFDYDEVARGPKFTVGSHQTPFEPTGIEYDTLEAAKAAAQSDYETRIRSAIVDVPAVDLEPVGYASDYGLSTLAGKAHHYCLSVNKSAENEFTRPLYAHPPVSALVNAQADADVVERWQPIETAPKDGTKIIVFGQYGVCVAWWGAGAFNRKIKAYDRDWTDGATYGFEPTHWCPLPAPPALRSSGSAEVGSASISTGTPKTWGEWEREQQKPDGDQ